MRFPFIASLLLLTLPTLAADPFEIKDKDEFAKIVPAGAKVERLATGMNFT